MGLSDFNKHIPCNKQGKRSDKCLVIDVAILSVYNMQKATEEISKNVYLEIECQRIWDKKVEVIPVIIGATGLVENNLKKYLGRILGHH